MLLLLDGLSGAGKSYICSQLINEQWVYISKYTNRPKRLDECSTSKSQNPIDKTITDQKFKEKTCDPNFLHYKFGHYRYGFYLNNISSSFNSSQNSCMIIRDISTALKIKNTFGQSRNVLILFIEIEQALAQERLISEGSNIDSVRKRLSRDHVVKSTFHERQHLYDAVINNNSCRKTIQKTIHNIVRKFKND